MFVNHKICQTLQPDSNFGFHSKNLKLSLHHVPCKTEATKLSEHCFKSLQRSNIVESDSSTNLLTRSTDICFPEISVLDLMKFLRRLSQGLQSNAAIIHSSEGNCCKSLPWVAFPNTFSQRAESPTDLQFLQELVALQDTVYIFFSVIDICPRSSCCDTSKTCYIFRQVFPLKSGIRKDNIATWLHLPPIDFCHLPRFGRHLTSPNQGLSSLAPFGVKKWKTLGKRWRESKLSHITVNFELPQREEVILTESAAKKVDLQSNPTLLPTQSHRTQHSGNNILNVQ